MKCDVLMKIRAKVRLLPSTVEILVFFETLWCKTYKITARKKLPGICSEDETHYKVDANCDWS